MTWITSYIGSNFALIAVVILTAIALGAVAWFTKNWKVAVTAGAILAIGLAYQQIDKNAYQRRVAEEAAAKIRILQGHLDVLNSVTKADAKRAAKDAAEIDALRTLAGATPANAAIAVPLDAAKRIGAIK
jgi:hypothetical protein